MALICVHALSRQKTIVKHRPLCSLSPMRHRITGVGVDACNAAAAAA